MLKVLIFLLSGVISMTAQAHSMTEDDAKILSNIRSFSTFADQNAFEYLGRLFSENVIVDYTSAFGGEPASVHRAELMKQWAGLLPGFDATYHDLSNIKVNRLDSTATVTADITASHFLGENGFWQISGSYTFELERENDNWKITSLTLVAGNEKGSRDVLGKAMEQASENLVNKNAQRLVF